MPTQSEYDAATRAVTAEALSEESALDPLERAMIPAGIIPKLAQVFAKVAVDAAEKVRSTKNQQT